jgi:quercetin dioxygenase-like cupin family protein
MQINADFRRRAVVHAARLDWVASPMPGVERRMLDRIGEEVARATSIVRYAPASRFAPHTHDGGEEFLVLDGVFQDEHGDYPAGTYVRNPPGSRHAPGSADGCTILVKLRQFDPTDRTEVRIGPGQLAWRAAPGRPGVAAAALFADARERVRLERWAPATRVQCPPAGGLELLCLEGGFIASGERFAALSWLRLPEGDALDAVAGSEGARVWLKEGHLAGLTRAPAA